MALLTVVNDKGLVDSQEDQTFTLLHDNGFSNVASLFDQASRLLPDEDRLTGGTWHYRCLSQRPLSAPPVGLPEFVAAVAALTSKDDYHRLAERFAVRRTNPAFWTHSDAIRDSYRRINQLDAGLFD